MKRFLMFSVSVLCLAVVLLIGIYIGAQVAKAQGPDPSAVQEYRVALYSSNQIFHFVMLPNGNLYARSSENRRPFTSGLNYVGNFWEGAVSNDKSSWGDIKGQFNK